MEEYMKRFTFLLCVMIVATFNSCTNHIEESINILQDDEFATESGTRATVQQDLQRLSALGYDISDAIVTQQFIILEGKYKIQRSKINLLSETQSQTSNVIIHPHYRRIGILFKSGGDATQDKIDGVIDAIRQWNDVGSDVEFGVVSDFEVTEELPVVVTWDFDDYSTYAGNKPCELVLVGARDKDNAPISSISINTGYYIWNYLTDNLCEEYCYLHALARIAGFASLETFDEKTPCSILHNPKFYTRQNFFLFGISSIDAGYINSIYSKVDIEPYSYSLTPAPLTGSEPNTIFPNKDYSLSLNNDSGCCTNADIFMKVSVYDDSGNDVTTEVVSDDTITTDESFSLNFAQVGQYSVNVKVYDEYIGNAFPVHRVENIGLIVRGNHFASETDDIALNEPYDVTYHYWNPEYPNATIEYSIEEVLFPESDFLTVAHLTQTDGVVTATLHYNGCYYVKAIVKDNGAPIDTAYCNLTKLIRLPESENSIVITRGSVSEVVPSSIDLDLTGDPIQLATYIAEEYNYDIEINSFGLGRFACLVESEYENRNNFVLDNSIVRRVDRQWFMRLHTLSTPSILETMTSELPTLYLLYNTEPNDQGFERWRYEYYTGYVHCPLNGIREVENMKLYNLPMQTVEANRIGFSEQRLGFGYEE